MQKIRKGDKVRILTGRDKGRDGQVLKVIPKENRAVVQGLNMVSRHTKQTPRSEGGIVAKEAAIDLSNLALLDPSTGKPTRIGFKTLADGRKVRVAKGSGEVIDV